MRSLWLLAWVLLWAYGGANAPLIQAKSAVLIEASTGQVLYAKDAHRRLPPASLTKVMTALIVLEHADMDEVVVASKNAVNTPSSSMHLQEGERVKVRDLLYALMLRSANDAAVALAEHVSGSVAQFVQMMNARARTLGAKNTHFVNPHGLHEPNHLSTAYDLALMARVAMENPHFREIVKQKSYLVERSHNQEDLLMVSRAKFLEMYEGAEGIKTGYTRPAGYCFVGSATRYGRRLIAVVLNSPQREQDTIALMDYGFYEWQPLLLGKAGEVVGYAEVEGGTQQRVPLQLAQDALWVVPRAQQVRYRWEVHTPRLSAPFSSGQQVGRAVLVEETRPILTVPLITAESVDKRSYPWTAIAIVGLTAGSLTLLRFRRRAKLAKGYLPSSLPRRKRFY